MIDSANARYARAEQLLKGKGYPVRDWLAVDNVGAISANQSIEEMAVELAR